MTELGIVLKIYNKILNSKVKGILKVLGYFLLLTALVFHQKISYVLLNSNIMHGNIQKNKEVRRELKKLSIQYKSSYVAINLFNENMTTMSRKYEYKAHDTLKDLTYKILNFSVNPFLDAFDSLEVDRYYYIKDLSRHGSQYFRDQVGYYGFKSVLYVGVFNKRWFFGSEELTGFMTYEYFHTTNFSKSEVDSMVKQVYNKIKYLIR